MKCIIVGAGAAGLLAGYCLTRHGIDVNILEAQEQIGGRICRVNAPNFSSPLDLGAEFVHGDLGLTKKIQTRAGGIFEPVAGKFYRVYNGNVEHATGLTTNGHCCLTESSTSGMT